MYMKSREEYISQYYASIDFIHNNETVTTKFSLDDKLDQQITIKIATDGGAKEKRGSIGFVIDNDNKNRYIESWGQPSGYVPQSFCAEVCSALAAINLLKHYIELY